MTSPLRIVPTPAPSESPEDALRRLISREDELVRELAEVRQAMREPIRRYAEVRGLMMLPRIESVKREILR